MLNWIEIAEEIEDLFVGDAKVWRRPSVGHVDPLGGDFPLVTREGHNVLDVIFTSSIVNLGRFDSEHVGEVQAFSPCSSETKL